jgi:hypothetical protein
MMILSILWLLGFAWASTQPTDLWDVVRSQLGSIDDVKIVMCMCEPKGALKSESLRMTPV